MAICLTWLQFTKYHRVIRYSCCKLIWAFQLIQKLKKKKKLNKEEEEALDIWRRHTPKVLIKGRQFR